MPDNPHTFVETALAALQAAVHDKDAELRTLQLATVSPDGNPSVRSVVLRGFDRETRVIEFHADALSEKLRDLAARPHAALLAWSAADRLQLRLDGSATIHVADDAAAAAWDGLSRSARSAYAFTRRPGDPIDDPDAPQRTDDEAAMFRRFAVIRITVERLDVLRLDGAAGQRRAIRPDAGRDDTAFVSP